MLPLPKITVKKPKKAVSSTTMIQTAIRILMKKLKEIISLKMIQKKNIAPFIV